MEGRAESLAQPLSSLGGCFVAEAGGAGEVFLDRLDVTVQLHDDIIVTSSTLSVKCDFAAR